MLNKKIKLILGMIIGLIILAGGVYAAGRIYSNQVEIDKTGGKLANVNGTKLQDALDYLYSQVGKCPKGYTCSKYAYLPTSDNTTYTQSEFVRNLEVGDLIKMTPSNASFQTDGNKTGYEPQTINSQELNLWRVIRKNSNGTVDVVSEYVSSVDVYFRGEAGYTNYIGYLNEIASYYENSNYTIGSRYMGYNGQTEYIKNPSKFNGQSNSAPWTSNTSASTTSEDEALGAGDMGYETDYNLVKAAYTGTTTYGSNTSGTATAYKVGTTTPTQYWIASRFISYNYSIRNGSSNCTFYGRCAANDAVGGTQFRVWNNSGGWFDAYDANALRPILTLKADVTSSSGNGKSEATAYVLG